MALIGERIKYLRETHNQSQSELANILGVSRSTISMVELGKRDLDHDTLEAVADYYNVDMNYLWGFQNESNSHRFVSDDEFRRVMAQRSEKDKAINTLLANISKLTPENRAKLADYLALLLQSQK